MTSSRRTANPLQADRQGPADASLGVDADRCSEDQLQAWLEAEKRDDDPRAEHALFELLSKLPDTLDAEQDECSAGNVDLPLLSAAPSRVGRAVISIGRVTEGFTERVIDRLELQARRGRSIRPVHWVAGAATALLVCWLGALVYAGLLGVEPGASSPVVSVLRVAGLLLSTLSNVLVSLASGAAVAWESLGAVRGWAYSPWLLGSASLVLLSAGGALLWLDRLVPREVLVPSVAASGVAR